MLPVVLFDPGDRLLFRRELLEMPARTLAPLAILIFSLQLPEM
jgi:hypothetical protein